MGKSNGKSKPKPSYYRVSRAITQSPAFKDLPPSAQILYWQMNSLRNQFTNGKNWTPERWFWRSNQMLMEDCGWSSYETLYRSRKALLEAGFILQDRTKSPPRYMICDDLYQKEQEGFCDKNALSHNPLWDLSDDDLPI